jgi:desulfoferrodoxin (superoxide reductase-like protein)
MSQHRPYVSIVIDVFEDDLPHPEATDAAIAQAAWSNVIDWVNNGYLPVVEVVTDDHSVDIDIATGEEA